MGYTKGKYCIISKTANIFQGTKIGNFVVIGDNVIIGRDCLISDGVQFSGNSIIGDRVTIRNNSIIARGVRIYSDVFISPQFMTENLNHLGKAVGGACIGRELWLKKTKYRVFIGTNVTLAAGISIYNNVIIGSKANVRNSIFDEGVYVGNPAKKIRVGGKGG